MSRAFSRLMWSCAVTLIGVAGVVRAQPPEQLREVRSMKSDEGVRSVAVSPDGKRIIAAIYIIYSNCDGYVQVWDAETGRELFRLKGPGLGPTQVRFSPDGKRIVAAMNDKTVIVWDAQTGKEVFTLKGHEQAVTCVAISSDGKHIVSGTKWSFHAVPGDGPKTSKDDVRVWDAATGKLLRSIKVKGGVTVVAISPDGKRISSIDGSNNGTGKVVVWDLETGQQVRALNLTGPFDGNYVGAAFSPDGTRIANRFSTTKGTLIIRDTETGKALRTIEVPNGLRGSVSFSPDGKRIACGCGDNAIRLWDVETGRETAVSNKGRHHTHSLTFSRDGKWIVEGNYQVTIWALGK